MDLNKILPTLEAKAPEDLILVIGSGLSAAVVPNKNAFKSFKLFLMAVLDAAEHLEILPMKVICDNRKKILSEKDLLIVAQNIIKQISLRSGKHYTSYYVDCLSFLFGNVQSEVTCPDVLNSILDLLSNGSKVITTNYDLLLETAGIFHNKAMTTLDMRDKSKVLRWAEGQTRYGVLHIHGTYSDPSGILMNPSEYFAGAQDAEFMVALQRLFYGKSFVFIGCGQSLMQQIFQVINWENIFQQCNAPQFMLTIKKDEDNYFKLMARMKCFGIKVVAVANFPAYVKTISSNICRKSTSVCGQQEPAKKKKSVCECGSEPSKKMKPTDVCGQQEPAKKKSVCECGSEPSMKMKPTDVCGQQEPGKNKLSVCDCDPPKKEKPTDGPSQTTKCNRGSTDPLKKFNKPDDDGSGGSCQL